MPYRKSEKPAEPWFDWKQFADNLTQAIYKGLMVGFGLGMLGAFITFIGVNGLLNGLLAWISGIMGVVTFAYGAFGTAMISEHGDFPWDLRPSRIIAHPIFVTAYVWAAFYFGYGENYLNSNPSYEQNLFLVGGFFTCLAVILCCWAGMNKRFLSQREKKED